MKILRKAKWLSLGILLMVLNPGNTIETRSFGEITVHSMQGELASGTDLNVSLHIGDILVYNVSWGGNHTFQKYELTNHSTNATHTRLSFDFFEAPHLSQFNETTENQTESILSGNMSEDLFSEATMFNFVLLKNTNFTDHETQVQGLLDQFSEIDNVRANLTVMKNGLSLIVSMYYRVVVYVLMFKIELYYSSQRILLKYRAWSPVIAEAKMSCTIMPEYSTPASAGEDPMNPLGVENPELPPDDSEQSVIFDTTAILIIGGIVGIFVGGIFGIRALILRRKKKKLPMTS